MPKPESEYSEALSTFRHYSHLRFAELTLFVAINSGLGTLACAYGGPVELPGIPRGHLPGYIIAAGVITALIFLGLEISRAVSILKLRTWIVTNWRDCHLAVTPRWALWLPALLLPLAYVMVMVWWWQRPILPMNVSP